MKRQLIVSILEAYNINPEQNIETPNGNRTAFEILEEHIMNGLDEITDSDS